MFTCPASNGMRERPRVMSSASATRTTPASSVVGRCWRLWQMMACSESDQTAMRAWGSG